MKVFVPYFADSTGQTALDDATLVPFEHGYTMLCVERIESPGATLEPGQAEVIPSDWPRAPHSLPQTSVYRATMSS